MIALDNRRINEQYGDVTEFDVIIDGKCDVDEFIASVLHRNRGKGYITIKARNDIIRLERCEYHGNKIVKNTIPEDDMLLTVASARAIRFDGNTNYIIEAE